MPKLAYRLTVQTAYGSLYRSFRDAKTALFMAKQAKNAGHQASVTVYETDKIDAFADGKLIVMRAPKTKK